MIGAYFMVTAINILGLPAWLGIPAVVVAMAAFGLVFTRLVYYPLRLAGLLPFIIATVGTSMLLQDLAMLTWGPVPIYLPRFFGNEVLTLGPVRVIPQHVVIIVATAALLVLQYVVFTTTSIGKMMRATAQDMQAAALVGIRTPVMIALTFVNSSVLAGLGGVLVGPLFSVTPSMGFAAMLKGFIGCAIGGWGNIPGTVIGGILVGVLEMLFAGHVSSVYRDAFVFGVLILFLLVRPQGIFGEEVSEKV
jgi:branched-chain amino acid transport system permease protein